jgi:hypothetical protein
VIFVIPNEVRNLLVANAATVLERKPTAHLTARH